MPPGVFLSIVRKVFLTEYLRTTGSDMCKVKSKDTWVNSRIRYELKNLYTRTPSILFLISLECFYLLNLKEVSNSFSVIVLYSSLSTYFTCCSFLKKPENFKFDYLFKLFCSKLEIRLPKMFPLICYFSLKLFSWILNNKASKFLMAFLLIDQKFDGLVRVLFSFFSPGSIYRQKDVLIRLRLRRFLRNLTKFLRTDFLQNHSRQVLLPFT